MPSETTSADDLSAAAPERPLRRDAARNRERILAAAREVFAERGLQATLDDVARHAGVGVGTVYRRFPDKDELIDALFHDRIDALAALAEEACAADDPWVGLTSFLEGALARQAEDRGLRDVASGGQRGGERLDRARAQMAPLVGRLVDRARDSGQLRPDVVTADVPLIQLMLFGVIEATHEFSPDVWRRYLAIVLDGLRARPGEPSELPVEALSMPQVSLAMRAAKARRGRPCESS